MQDLLRLATFDNSTLYLMNLDKNAVLQMSYGKDVKAEDLITGFQKIKSLSEEIFKENVITYELSFSGIEERKLKTIDISISSSIFDSPKIFGYRIISALKDSEKDIRFSDIKEIRLEPMVDDITKTFVSVTIRDRGLNEEKISSIFKEVETIVNSLTEKS